MLTWNVAFIAQRMQREKLANANQLSEFAGLTIPTAYNVLKGAPLQRVDVSTLETLARALKIKNPLALLLWSDDE